MRFKNAISVLFRSFIVVIRTLPPLIPFDGHSSRGPANPSLTIPPIPRVPDDQLRDVPEDLPAPELPEHAEHVLEARYLRWTPDGELDETSWGMVWRVARAVAEAERPTGRRRTMSRRRRGASTASWPSGGSSRTARRS